MSRQPSETVDLADVTAVLAVTDATTTRLLCVVDELDDEACRRPSRLPGWTRGHLVTHLARNADALANVLTWARTGEPSPMYASLQARDLDIEAGAARSPVTLAADLREACARWRDLAGELDAPAWSTTLEWRPGTTRPTCAVPGARLTEVVVHGHDLDRGLDLDGVPRAAADVVIEQSLVRLAGQAAVPPFEVRAVDDGASPQPSGDRPVVSGTRGQLVRWLSGRGADPGLVCTGGPLPRLPAW